MLLGIVISANVPAIGSTLIIAKKIAMISATMRRCLFLMEPNKISLFFLLRFAFFIFFSFQDERQSRLIDLFKAGYGVAMGGFVFAVSRLDRR